MEGDYALEVKGLTKRFNTSNGIEFTAIRDLSFWVFKREVVCIVGKTGCGKSTLINLLLGIDYPTEGSIVLDGLSPTQDFKAMRQRLAAVFQSDRLLPWRSVLDNAALGLEVAGRPVTERLAAARGWLKRVGLEGWETSYPGQLSGGMRQRVAIARAFVLDPIVIILDEAFGHLDEVTAQSLRNDCLSLIHETGKTAIVVTHNITEALAIGSRILVLGRPAHLLCSLDITEHKRQRDWPLLREQIRDLIFKTIEREPIN